MGKQDRSSKDKERASRMKALGIRRTVQNCVSCHRPVSLGAGYVVHLQTCPGRPRRTR